MVEGRGFSLRELKRALVAASGARLTEFYVVCWDLEVWELLEAIELVSDLRGAADTSDQLWDTLVDQVS